MIFVQDLGDIKNFGRKPIVEGVFLVPQLCLFAEVQTTSLVSPLETHAARFGNFREVRPMPQALFVAVTCTRRTNAEGFHISLTKVKIRDGR